MLGYALTQVQSFSLKLLYSGQSDIVWSLCIVLNFLPDLPTYFFVVYHC